VTGTELENAYRDHGHMVLRRARRILGNEEEARDIVQELFTQLARGRGFEGRSSVTTFLYAATTNLCLTRIRNEKTRARLLAARPPAGEAAAATAEARVTLAELLGELPRELADVAVYYHADEMTQEEIAEVLGCSRRRVGDLLARLHAQVGARWRAA
jgi:RNA polymerase sigma-70 factor (ECF subfamily)